MPPQCLTWPSDNWDINKVQVLEVSHISLVSVCQVRPEQEVQPQPAGLGLRAVEIKADMVKYELLIVPRDEDEHDEAAMEKA